MFRSLLLAALVLAACKGKPPAEDKPDPKAVKTPGSDRTPPVENAWTPAQQKDIVLPERANSAPIKTTAPLTTDKMAKLGELKFDEWDSEVRTIGPPKLVNVRFTTKSRPFVMVTVIASPCEAKTCPPMDYATWKLPENAGLLNFAINSRFATIKNPVLDSGAIDFFGQKMIFEYHLGEAVKSDDDSNVSSVFGHAYTLFWNDGINQIHVTAEYRDMPAVTQEALGKIMPRGNFETIARAFMDYYTHAWL